MRVCGVDLKGNEARLAIAFKNSDSGEIAFLQNNTKKIVLGDDQEEASLRGFMHTAKAFLSDNQITNVVIKTRARKGKMAGGATSFKMEAALQLIEDCSCHFVNPVAIAQFVKKSDLSDPQHILEYQRDAFNAAAYFLSKNS
jgi:hypothetical protein